MWPAFALLGAVALVSAIVPAFPVWLRRRRHSQAGMEDVDRMPGREFEHYLGLLFERLGYSVEVTKAHGDYGADLLVKQDGRRILVQAKRWTKPVGIHAIQEAAAARPYYKADAALVVSNRFFTPAARQLARANQVQLWDRDTLARRIVDAGLGTKAGAAIDGGSSTVTSSAAPNPICLRCGSAMVLRGGPHGHFYGCSNFPRCRYTRPLMSAKKRQGSSAAAGYIRPQQGDSG
jgi:restriction system protein